MAFAAILYVLSGNCSAGEEEVPVLIVNAGAPVSILDINTIRSIFTRKLTRWPDGERIRVFVLADDNAYHRQFVKSRLGLFPYQLRQIWDRMMFSGIGEPPESVDTLSEMINRVKSTPGSIGYAPKGENNEKQGVRYVNLD